MYAGDHTKGNCRKTTLPAQQLNGQNEESEHQYPEQAQANSNDLSESSPEISTCESDSSYPRFVLITSSHGNLLSHTFGHLYIALRWFKVVACFGFKA